MKKPPACDHTKTEKVYFEDPVDEPDYKGIWNVQTNYRYVPVSAIVLTPEGKARCTMCGETFQP